MAVPLFGAAKAARLFVVLLSRVVGVITCPVEYLRRGLGGLDSAWEWLRSIKSTLLNIYYYGYKGVENTPRWLD